MSERKLKLHTPIRSGKGDLVQLKRGFLTGAFLLAK